MANPKQHSKPKRKEPVPFLDVRNSVIILGNAIRRVVVRPRTLEPRDVGTVYRGGLPAARSTFQRALAGDLIVQAERGAKTRVPRLSVVRVDTDPDNEKKLVEIVLSEDKISSRLMPELEEWLMGVTLAPVGDEGLLPTGCGWDGVTTVAARALIEKIRSFIAGVPATLFEIILAQAAHSTGLAKALNWKVPADQPLPRLLPTIQGLIPMGDTTKPFDVVLYYNSNGRVSVAYPKGSFDIVPEDAVRAAVFRVNANRRGPGNFSGLKVRLFARRRDVTKIQNP